MTGICVRILIHEMHVNTRSVPVHALSIDDSLENASVPLNLWQWAA